MLIFTFTTCDLAPPPPAAPLTWRRAKFPENLNLLEQNRTAASRIKLLQFGHKKKAAAL